MKAFVLVTMLAGLAGCGVDGPPTPPKGGPAVPVTGVTVSGEVSAGVVGQL
jgi:predicted small lipoprotein YifL